MNTQGTQGNQATPHPVRSEIAQFLERWDAEVEATQRALKGYAITARHDFINKRLQAFADENMVELMEQEAQEMSEVNKEQNNASSQEDQSGVPRLDETSSE